MRGLSMWWCPRRMKGWVMREKRVVAILLPKYGKPQGQRLREYLEYNHTHPQTIDIEKWELNEGTSGNGGEKIWEVSTVR